MKDSAGWRPAQEDSDKPLDAFCRELFFRTVPGVLSFPDAEKKESTTDLTQGSQVPSRKVNPGLLL